MVMTADPEPDTPPAFNRCGGHPALDFVNTLDNRFAADGPVELLGDYGALLRFAAQSQLVEARHAAALAKSVSPAAAARALRAARELREALAAVLYAGVAGGPPAGTGNCAGSAAPRIRPGLRSRHGSGVASPGRRICRYGRWRSRRPSSCCRTRWNGYAPAGRTRAAGCSSTPARITRAAGAT